MRATEVGKLALQKAKSLNAMTYRGLNAGSKIGSLAGSTDGRSAAGAPDWHVFGRYGTAWKIVDYSLWMS